MAVAGGCSEQGSVEDGNRYGHQELLGGGREQTCAGLWETVSKTVAFPAIRVFTAVGADGRE